MSSAHPPASVDGPRTKRYWVSDLHLFSRRSLGERHRAAIRTAAAGAETFVLGGDIFDFSWTTRGTVSESVDEAAVWLADLIEHAPHCRFYFLLGNHDYHQLFIDRLAMLEDGLPNFTWHPFHLRLGNTLFLHGDVVDRPMDAQELVRHRERWLQAGRRAAMWHVLYDLVVLARLHRTASTLVYRDRKVTRRILRYLEEIGHGRETGLRHVYFGHTHVPMSHYEYRGVRFHNGGAPLKGVRFRMLEPIIA